MATLGDIFGCHVDRVLFQSLNRGKGQGSAKWTFEMTEHGFCPPPSRIFQLQISIALKLRTQLQGVVDDVICRLGV